MTVFMGLFSITVFYVFVKKTDRYLRIEYSLVQVTLGRFRNVVFLEKMYVHFHVSHGEHGSIQNIGLIIRAGLSMN